MLKYSLIALALLFVTSSIVWFTVPPLSIFDGLVPKDRRSQRLARDIAYGPEDRQALDIFAPTGARDGEALPVVVFIHGGGWRDGFKEGYDFAGRALAAQGFVAVVINYRLSPQVHFPGFVEDGAAAVRWVRSNIGEYGGNGEQIVLIGHSAGAHIAAMLALDEQWLGADRDAVAGWVGVAGPYDFLPLDSPSTRGAFGRVADLATTQPINFVSAGDPPALLLHGGTDDTVNPRQSVRMERLLTEAGVPVQRELYEGVGHLKIITALSRWTRGSAPILRDIDSFVRGLNQ